MIRIVTWASMGDVARQWSSQRRWFPLAVLLLGLLVIASGWLLRDYLFDLRLVGYPGVFLLSFLGSVTMLLPVPGLLSVCGVSLWLSPLAIGFLAGLGETLGEISGYAVGYGGGTVVKDRPLFTRLRGWMERRGVLVIFLVSIIPNPVFDLVGIAAGGVRYPLHQFLAIVWVGKTLKGLLVGYSCLYGASQLPWLASWFG